MHRALSEVLEAAGNIEVMVIGGVAKLMYGIRCSQHDLDLFVNPDDLPAIDSRLANYRAMGPHFSDNDFFSGTLGTYRIGNIDMEISGGLLVKGNSFNCLLELDSELISRAKEFCERPLVIPLEEQLIFDFVRRDKPEKVGMLLDYFRKNEPDMGSLRRRMEKHSLPADVRAMLLAAVGGA